MMRSLYSGVAGLKTHQIKMDVIGNNIANVNTVAYKSQSITFAELMYQTTQSASGPNAETGRAGVNAKQIGLGVQSAAISTAMLALAVPRMTEEDFAALDAILDEQRSATDTITSENLNIRFHEVLTAKANNPVADMLMEIIHANIDRYLRSGFYSDAADREISVTEHEKILAACKAGNADEAIKLLQAHIMDAVALIPENVH